VPRDLSPRVTETDVQTAESLVSDAEDIARRLAATRSRLDAVRTHHRPSCPWLTREGGCECGSVRAEDVPEVIHVDLRNRNVFINPPPEMRDLVAYIPKDALFITVNERDALRGALRAIVDAHDSRGHVGVSGPINAARALLNPSEEA
jgi:hypothetical protein